MTRKVGSVLVVLVGGLIAGSGCTPPATGIAQLDPYTGSRPGRIRRLPPPRPRQPRVARTRPQRDWTPPRGFSNRWKYIVIHHSASDQSTPQGMRDWHINGRGWDELGYHFVIGNGVGYQDGKIYVGKRWQKQMHGAHCKTPGNRYNNHGIGICLIGNLESHAATPRQVEALARLASFLCDRCGISRSRILTHGGVTNKTACPGRYFSLGPVLRRMSARAVSASSK